VSLKEIDAERGGSCWREQPPLLTAAGLSAMLISN